MVSSIRHVVRSIRHVVRSICHVVSNTCRVASSMGMINSEMPVFRLWPEFRQSDKCGGKEKNVYLAYKLTTNFQEDKTTIRYVVQNIHSY